MNSVNLTGRMVRDAELKFTPSGKAIAGFTVAVNRGFKDKETGESTADFIKCTIWDKQAESLAQYTKKGSQVAVEGSIRTGSYEKDGKKVYTTEVQATRVEFLDSKSTKQDDEVNGVFFGDDLKDDDVPF